MAGLNIGRAPFTPHGSAEGGGLGMVEKTIRKTNYPRKVDGVKCWEIVRRSRCFSVPNEENIILDRDFKTSSLFRATSWKGA